MSGICRATFLLSSLLLSFPTWIAYADDCPKAIVFDAAENSGVLDLGFTGSGHGAPLSGWSLRMALGPCAGDTVGSCGECPIVGLLAGAGGRNQRCVNDAAVRC